MTFATALSYEIDQAAFAAAAVAPIAAIIISIIIPASLGKSHTSHPYRWPVIF